MKKIVLILNVTLLLTCFIYIIFFNYFYGACLEVYLNHGVLLSKPISLDIIYRYEFGEGEDFYIFNYDNDIKKIIQKNDFEKITKNNLEEVTKVLNMYRDDLCEKELSLFDKTTSISELAKIGYYYLYLEDDEDEDDYLVQIIIPKQKKIYHFNINH